MPASSSALRIALSVGALQGWSDSSRVTVFGDTSATLASSRTLILKAALAILACAPFKIIERRACIYCDILPILVRCRNGERGRYVPQPHNRLVHRSA
jgi:hypothetical protein